MSSYKDRRAFLFIGGTAFLQDADDKRNAMQWALEDFNITGHVWEELTRGHMTDTEITFFTGGVAHNPDPYVGEDIIVDILAGWQWAYDKPADCMPDVYNGVFTRYGQQDERWPRILKWNWKDSKWDKANEV